MFNKRILSSILAVFLVLSMVLGLCACGGKDKDLKTILNDSVSQVFDSLAENYSKNSNILENGLEAEFSVGVTLDDSIIDIAEEAAGINMSWINNFGFKADYSMKDQFMAMTMALLFNAESELSLDYVYDLEKLDMHMAIPELSDLYAKVSGFDEYASDFDFNAFSSSFAANMISEEDYLKLRDSMEGWASMLINTLDNASKTSGEFKANGVTQKCTIYEKGYTEKDLMTLLYNVAKDIADDEDLRAILSSATADVPGYEDFDSSLEDLSAMLDEFSEMVGSADSTTVMFKLRFYVSGDEIIAFGATIPLEGVNYDIICGSAKNGSDIGFECSMKMDYSGFVSMTLMELLGDLKEDKNGVTNGELKLSLYGMDLAYINVENYSSKDDTFKGSFTFEIADDMSSLINSDAAFMLSGFALKYDIEAGKNTFDSSMSIINNGESLGSIDLYFSYLDSTDDIKIPTNTTEDLTQWENSLDIDKFLANTNIPEDIISMIEGLFYGIQ